MPNTKPLCMKFVRVMSDGTMRSLWTWPGSKLSRVYTIGRYAPRRAIRPRLDILRDCAPFSGVQFEFAWGTRPTECAILICAVHHTHFVPHWQTPSSKDYERRSRAQYRQLRREDVHPDSEQCGRWLLDITPIEVAAHYSPTSPSIHEVISCILSEPRPWWNGEAI